MPLAVSWRRILTLAAKLELPIIIVVLPEAKGKKDAGVSHVSAKARSCGVPGIPVDSSDAVALYRVAQESIGRVRAGGGPVVIDCVGYRTRGKIVDPIVQMKGFLLERKVGTSEWMDRAGDTFRERLRVASK